MYVFKNTNTLTHIYIAQQQQFMKIGHEFEKRARVEFGGRGWWKERKR